MSLDNPYYFYNGIQTQNPPSNTPTPTSTKGFSFFRRRSSSSSSTTSTKSLTSIKVSKQSKQFNSATLSSADLAGLGARRSLNLRSSTLNQIYNQRECSNSQGVAFGERSQAVEVTSPQDNRFKSGRNLHHQNYPSRQRLGSYNESTCYSETDDVFMPSNQRFPPTQLSTSSETSAPNSGGLRRHSFGTFLCKDRLRSGTISDEVPKMPAPRAPLTSIPHASAFKRSPKKSNHHRELRRGDSCAATPVNLNMDDILIVTSRQSEPAILWANYLKTRFDKITKQRGIVPFNFLHVKIDDNPLSEDIIQRCQSTKLQIVVVCQSLINLPKQLLATQLSSILRTEIVLGILLEVTEDKILENYRSSLPAFKKWRRCAVRNQDQSFVGEILGIATDILGRALCQRPLCSDAMASALFNSSTAGGKSAISDAFTVLPRKVKVGANKVVALLNEPLNKDDKVVIRILKTDESYEALNVKRRNPYTLQFTIPEICMEVSTMVDIKLEKNGTVLGSRPVKCESRLRELEQVLKSLDAPLEFMCQSMGVAIGDREQIDAVLVQAFQKNLPPNFHLLSAPMTRNGFPNVQGWNTLRKREGASEEYPTLLHFAAKWGLDRLSMQLLECSGGDAACEIRNYSGKTPAELADSCGHTKLAASLRSFSQMNEFTTMYHYFKGISETGNSSEVMVEVESSRQTVNLDTKSDDYKPQSSLKNTMSSQEYMEMNGSGSDADLCSSSSSGTINAVTNLNYINVECVTSRDDEITNEKHLESLKISADNSKHPEMDQKLLNKESQDVVDHRASGSASGIITSNILRIDEPAYFDSDEINTKPMDQFSLECSQRLENCSASDAQSDYLQHPSNIPVEQFGDYLTHPSNKPVVFDNYVAQPTNRRVVNAHDDELSTTHLRMNFQPKIRDTKNNGTLQRQGSDASKTSVDDELLEIINDFKNNVFTIQEVEQLVASWKNRNDVQQSFKDKQDQLAKMRAEYERIQEHMQEKMKRPTPFERVRKLFTRSKSQSKDHNNESKEYDRDEKEKGHRPMSSLSLQSVSSSSSSSGRMSTGSACSGTSLGDSGTHSDHEERRNIYSTCRLGNAGSLMDNYLIPPTPRPIHSNGSPNSSVTLTPTEERDRPVLRISEHYIMFPSNVPVHPPSPITEQFHHDYMNFTSLNTIEESREDNHLGCVQPIKVQTPKKLAHTKIAELSSFKPTGTSFNDAHSDNIYRDNLEISQEDDTKVLNKSIEVCCVNQGIELKSMQETSSAEDSNYINV